MLTSISPLTFGNLGTYSIYQPSKRVCKSARDKARDAADDESIYRVLSQARTVQDEETANSMITSIAEKLDKEHLRAWFDKLALSELINRVFMCAKRFGACA